jgi:hypothetical protein
MTIEAEAAVMTEANGDQDERDLKIAELENTVMRQDIAIAVMRDRVVELEIELLNTRCTLRQQA